MECAFKGCTREVGVRKSGLCIAHYNQQWAGKELTPLRPYVKRKKAPEGYLHCKNCDSFKKVDDFYTRTNGVPHHHCKTCMIRENREDTIRREAREAAEATETTLQGAN